MDLKDLSKLFLARRSTITKTVRIMRLTAVLLFIACLHVSARGLGQTVTISEKNVPIQKIFKEIFRQTGVSIVYNETLFEHAAPVTVEVKDAPVQQALDQCLKNQPFDYTVENNMIVVRSKQAEVKTVTPPNDVHGRVTDSTGIPLEGASVTVKGAKKRGTTTNAKGEFDLKNIDDNATLVISFTGYVNSEIKLNSDKDISVILVRSTSKLDQVQIIAYGTTTQRLNTGDVSTVTSKEIEEQPVSNPLEALEGRVPGLYITQTTGLPGGAYNVQIRGQNSIAQGNTPFYVVDGVPYSSQLPASPLNINLYGGSPLNFINSYDIESIEVLKDADATAIYGSRAANGAILITTKKAKAGTMKFDVNIKSGVTNPARTVPILNTQQYLEMRHEAFNNDGETPGPGDHDINGDWDTTRFTNWPKEMANKSALFTDAEASLSGGNVNTQYLVGAGYTIQKTGYPTLLPGDGGDKKGSVHFNLNTISPDKRFKLQLSGFYLVDKNTVQSQDFTNTALTLPPDAPAIFNSDGGLNWAPLAPGEEGTWTNPYAVLNGKYVSNTSNLVSSAVLGYTLFKGLELSSSFGYTNTQTGEVLTTPTTAYDPNSGINSGTAQYNQLNSNSWIIEPQANYKLQLGKGLFTVLLGGTFQESKSSGVTTSGSGYISDALLEDQGAASQLRIRSNSSQYNYDAVFGRVGYNWMDKYILNINARRDGTSRFGQDKQFGNFGAVGVAWIFTKEDFIQRNLGFLSFGKIRASYGTTGSDQIGNYQYVDLYSVTGGVPYQGSQGLFPTNLANPTLAWETTKKLEGGIELGFLKDRIILQASVYQNRSGNELVQTPVSVVTGFSSIYSNLPALVQNSGEEFILNTINVRTKNFGWSSSINLTIARNKLVSFPGLASSPYANTLVIGQPINVLKLYHSLGVNDTTGLYEFASTKTGPTYNPNFLTDQTSLISLTPKYYGGFLNSFTYKSFSLDIFFQFVKQTGLKLWAASGIIPGTMYNVPTEALNRWQKPGDQMPFQQFTQDGGSNATNAYYYAAQGSDYAYGDASYVRLKNLAISWQMPASWIKKAGFANFRIYLQGQNLLTITKYDGMDPETQSAYTGPRRAYTAGLQIGW